MKKYLLVLTLFVFAFALTTGDAYAVESIYGHIAFIEGNPQIVRVDKTTETAVVNSPVAPGDTVYTDGKSRCELQFDNGTVMRIGKDSRLKVTTVLAQSLTSSWKMTTLELEKGKLYSINQSYNRERFQVMTPNAAVHLKNNSISTIEISDNGETLVFSDRGKFKLMYGKDTKSLKTETVKKGDTFTVTGDHQLAAKGKRNFDFVAWNQYIDKNFKELHYGVSKLPKKIYKYPKGIVHWAEKWSTLYGDWVYDDLFGYVWKPADQRFAYSARPFFHAKFTTINDQLFLVPQQAWGWAPAHMGTWVWMKWGWTWIPGDAFNTGVWAAAFPNSAQFQYSYHTSYMNPWMDYIYGGWDLYYTYRSYGRDAWAKAYHNKYKKVVSKPAVKDAPKHIRTIVRKLDKASLGSIKKRLGKYTAEMKKPLLTRKVDATGKTPRILLNPLYQRTTEKKASKAEMAAAKMKYDYYMKNGKAKKAESKKTMLTPDQARRFAAMGAKARSRRTVAESKFRDFNPDAKWSRSRNIKVYYSPRRNEVVCPRLKISSRMMTPAKIAAVRNGGKGSLTSSGNRPYKGSSGKGSSGLGTPSNSGSLIGAAKGGGKGGGTSKDGKK